MIDQDKVSVATTGSVKQEWVKPEITAFVGAGEASGVVVDLYDDAGGHDGANTS